MPPTPRPPRIWAPTTRNHPTGPPIRVALLVGSILAGCGDSLLPTSPEAPAEPEIVAFVAAMNEHRIEMGCDPLRWNPRAADVATAHSRDMVERGFFAHANPEGQGASPRISRWDFRRALRYYRHGWAARATARTSSAAR